MEFEQDALDSVNGELDSTLLQQLSLVQDYTNLTLEVERGMREGYFQIARSRYNMGSNSVGKSSLPNEDSERDYKATVRVLSTEEESQTRLSRQLLQTSSVEKDVESSTKQFGILTSPSLKTAQKSFQQTLQKTIERLNTAEELRELQNKVKRLSATKQELMRKLEAEA